MEKVYFVGEEPACYERFQEAVQLKGWAAEYCEDMSKVGEDAVAVVVVGDLGSTIRPRLGNTPVLLLASLDRSGWDRTFSDERALGADALLDLNVRPETLVKRIEGILAARDDVSKGGVQIEFGDILGRAICTEEAAEAFYRRAAAAVKTPDAKDVLEMLADQEAEHKQTLLDFRDGKRELPSEWTAATSVLETFGTPKITPDLSPADAFLLAARKEKLAVQFYEDWADLYPEGPEKEILKKLANTEREHQRSVENMFVNASFPEDYFE